MRENLQPQTNSRTHTAQAGVGMGVDRVGDHHGHHKVLVANIVKDNSVMRDGRIQVSFCVVQST